MLKKAKIFEKNNYSPTFLCHSLGCRVNQAEINYIKRSLIKSGFLPWSEKLKNKPDVIILNTCVVTRKAERETRKEIRHLKRNFSQSFLIVTGCAVNAQGQSEIKLPSADLFIQNQNKKKISKIILQKFPLYKKPNVFIEKRKRAFVKIQEGCNQFCAFCITAYIRGPLKSKPVKKIIKEIKSLKKEGVLDITLCGINLSLFGQDLKPKTNLVILIKDILQKVNISRLSLGSLNPNLINKKLINLYINDWQSGSKRLSSYFHITLQSGSKKILAKMNRPEINLNKLKNLLQYIKQEIPEFNLRADIIVGFPGETKKDFKATLHYIEEYRIAFAHIFRYSPRPGTNAYKMIKNGQWQEVSEKTKKERSKKLRNLIEKIRQEEAKKLIGQNLNCLILGKQKSYWRGLAENFWEVKIKSQKKLSKKIIPIQITGYQNGKLIAA